MPGVLAQHHDRMANDDRYRKAALSINPDGPGGGALGKYLKSDAPTSLTDPDAIDSNPIPPSAPGANMVDQTNSATVTSTDAIDELSGDELDQAVRAANIEGRSSMTADEKRAALRNR